MLLEPGWDQTDEPRGVDGGVEIHRFARQEQGDREVLGCDDLCVREQAASASDLRLLLGERGLLARPGRGILRISRWSTATAPAINAHTERDAEPHRETA